MAVKLSQLIPEVNEDGRSIRATIPVFINNNGKIISEKVTIYNLDDDTVKKITEELKDTEDQQKIFLTLVKYATDICVDDTNLEHFANFLTVFNETNKQIQMEIAEMWTEVNIVGMDAIQKFMSLDDSKKAKHILLNPEMAKVFEQLKEVTGYKEEPEDPTPSEEELEIMRKAEELKAKYKKE